MERRSKIAYGIALAATATLALAGCSGGSGSGSGSGSSAKDYGLINAGTLTVCSDVPYPPFEQEDKSSPSGFSGFDVDLVTAIAKKLDLKISIQVTNFDSLQSGTALVAGQCDMGASAMTITDARKKNIDFSDPYYDSLQSLLVKTDSGIKDINGLSGKNVGVQQGTTGENYAKQHAKGANLVQYPSDGELWPAMQAGQIDAILQDQPVNLVHEKADSKYKIVETYNTNESYGFAFAKGEKDALRKDVDAQLKALKDSGDYKKLYDKYFTAK
ncbi:transporter substrate-binding domain-containing protein [Microbacterium sp. ASV81]|uniref:Transporter substrate-binding domain-containing protein n=1 Tax=Microbacterium capsulatum TaxID=3041921 RepID=A0ABU0XPF8_9MICO|nr:transporter substrate-binding domain-containing protein [Microbacterium sp. ASV81]MDQ4215645.1 transporter substrate-binding domain-containing protein [Microbacterium sp. ASV81]